MTSRLPKAEVAHVFVVTDMLSELSHIPYGAVLAMWVKTPSRTKTGKTVLKEHRVYIDLKKALELRHYLDIAIEIQKEKTKHGL